MPTVKERLSGGTFKHVEGELYHFHETKKELRQILHTDKNQPTTQQRILHLEKVIEAISSVYDELPKEKKRLVKILYWSRPQKYNWEGIASQVPISKRQAQRWRKSIVEDIAYRLGWR
ncbi:transcriptional regulator [Priestia megaterium]